MHACAGQLAKLEASRTRRMAAAATIVQSAFRMHQQLLRYRKAKAAAQRIQANYRGRQLRRNFLRYYHNKHATIIQKYWRRYAAKKVRMALGWGKAARAHCTILKTT